MVATHLQTVFIQTTTASTMDVPPGTILGEFHGPTGSNNCPRCWTAYENNWCPRCGVRTCGHVRLVLVAGERPQRSPESLEGAQGRKSNKHWTKRKHQPRWAKPTRK